MLNSSFSTYRTLLCTVAHALLTHLLYDAGTLVVPLHAGAAVPLQHRDVSVLQECLDVPLVVVQPELGVFEELGGKVVSLIWVTRKYL